MTRTPAARTRRIFVVVNMAAQTEIDAAFATMTRTGDVPADLEDSREARSMTADDARRWVVEQLAYRLDAANRVGFSDDGDIICLLHNAHCQPTVNLYAEAA